MRLYDKGLVAKIRKKQYIKNVNGVDILFKPVPDDDREHVIDSRLLEIIKYKKNMFSSRAKVGYSLANERYRPDKVTYDLTETRVSCEERLIPINGDHRIDIFIYRPETKKATLPVLVYLHGGGFTAGDMRLYANQMKFISEQAEAVVVFPEYRLAPECPYPGAIEDANGTVHWVYDHAEELGIDKNCFMVAGDSAGGSLTNACVLKDEDGIIKKIVELYSGMDMSDYRTLPNYNWSYDDYEIIEEQKEFAYSRIDRIKNGTCASDLDNQYLQGKTTSRNPLVSLAYASDEQLKKFPDSVIIASEYDYLRVGSDYVVKRMTDLDVNVKSVRYNGCDHGFFDMLGTIVQAEDVCMLIAEEIKAMQNQFEGKNF